jgi:class 3 adenylate cyclase
VPWPAKLLEHPYCALVHLGAAFTAKNPAYAAAAAALDAASGGGGALKDQGPLLMAGLRVRMGINTGWCLAQHGFVAFCTQVLHV